MKSRILAIRSIREFEKYMEKIQSGKLVLVWCFAPCSTESRQLAQVLASEYPHVEFWQVNADRCKEFMELFEIEQLPTVMAWHNKELTYVEQYVSKSNVARIIEHKHHKPQKPSSIQSLVHTWHTIFLDISHTISQFLDVVLNNYYILPILLIVFLIFYLIFIAQLTYWLIFSNSQSKSQADPPTATSNFMSYFSPLALMPISNQSFEDISVLMKFVILLLYVPLIWCLPAVIEDLVVMRDRLWSRILRNFT